MDEYNPTEKNTVVLDCVEVIRVEIAEEKVNFGFIDAMLNKIDSAVKE